MSESLLACGVSVEGGLVSLVFVGDTKLKVLMASDDAVCLATAILGAAQELRELEELEKSAQAEPARVLRLVPREGA